MIFGWCRDKKCGLQMAKEVGARQVQQEQKKNWSHGLVNQYYVEKQFYN